MLVPNNQEEFAQDRYLSSLEQSKRCKSQIKPHQSRDLVGQRYVKYFWHPFRAIVALVPTGVSKPAWRTIDHYLHPSQLWTLHQNGSQLVGTRFDASTCYAIIDLDNGGNYRNSESINLIKAVLEDIGIVSVVPIQSSFSGGYHLILLFEEELPTFNLACVLEQTLKDAGLIPKKGHLEIFPNVKSYSEKGITNYNAIRCPMQPGSGALLLDDDLQPISDEVAIFLDHCDLAARRQDLTKLKRACKKARKRHNRERYHKQAPANVEEWRTDWEKTIGTGWTGTGQTNTLLQIIVGYGIVFQGLERENLVKYAVLTATSAPGYIQYCRHQREIEAKVRDWVECTIKHQWYTPYASYPERHLRTYANTFAEVTAGTTSIHQPSYNIIPFNRRQQQSIERSQQAQQRITVAVKTIEWETGLPAGAKARAQQICGEYKRQFHKSLSLETLHKYLHLWHPNSYIEDPWAGNSSNACQMEGYGYLDKEPRLEKNQKVQNPCQMEGYGYLSYMKVLCLPPAAPVPQGLESACIVEQQAEFGYRPTLQQPLESSVTLLNSEIANCFNNFHNFNSTSDDLSASLNTSQFNKTNSDKYSKYTFSSGAALNVDNQNLLNNFSGVVHTVSTPVEVPLSDAFMAQPSEQEVSITEITELDSSELIELKRIAKLRLQAISNAEKVVHKYRLITRQLLSFEERSHLKQTAKMQFYLDSQCPMLVAEALAWAEENPGCLPFSLESLF